MSLVDSQETPMEGSSASEDIKTDSNVKAVSPCQIKLPVEDAVFKEVVETLCDAFSDDPLYTFFLRRAGGIDVRKDFLEKMMKAFTRITLVQGMLFQSSNLTSVVFWLPPGIEPLSNIFKTGLWRDILTVPPSILKRTIVDYTLQADKIRAKYFKGRSNKKSYYVFLAATRKEHQGKGLLKYNMFPVLNKADEEGIVCYMECTKAANVPLYERFGFHTVGEFDVEDRMGKTHIYSMAREPQKPQHTE